MAEKVSEGGDTWAKSSALVVSYEYDIVLRKLTLILCDPSNSKHRLVKITL